jgi:hypothetical protein
MIEYSQWKSIVLPWLQSFVKQIHRCWSIKLGEFTEWREFPTKQLLVVWFAWENAAACRLADLSDITELILLVRRREISGERMGEKLPENCSPKYKRGHNCYRSRMGSPDRMGRRIATDRRICRGRQIRSVVIYSAVLAKPRKNHIFSQSEKWIIWGCWHLIMIQESFSKSDNYHVENSWSVQSTVLSHPFPYFHTTFRHFRIMEGRTRWIKVLIWKRWRVTVLINVYDLRKWISP